MPGDLSVSTRLHWDCPKLLLKRVCHLAFSEKLGETVKRLSLSHWTLRTDVLRDHGGRERQVRLSPVPWGLCWWRGSGLSVIICLL